MLYRNPKQSLRRKSPALRLEQLEERALLSGSPPFPNDLAPPALPAPTGPVVTVSTAAQLASAVAHLSSGQTILINPGTYALADTLYLPQNLSNVAIRGATGNSADVVIQGAGMSGNVLFGFWAGAVQGMTFADLTVRDFADHAFIFNAGSQAPLVHDVHMVDCGEQFIKANPDGAGGGVNNGVVEYCTIEYSTTAPTAYTNGVDVHTGSNWVIRDNVFRNIRAAGALAGPAVLVWNGSSNAVTEANTFIDCQRAIAYGLDDAKTNDNTGGVIRNNFVAETMPIGGDVGIYVCNSPNTQVLNNTLWMNADYPDAIEYRYADTAGVQILDNLTNKAIASRNGATATLAGNVTTAQSSWFVDTTKGDLHLVAGATGAIDKVAALANVAADYDGQARAYGALADVGADEYAPADTSTGLAAQERFVQALYVDALGRSGTKAELDGWVAVLNGPGGSRAVVASGIERSAEARARLVGSWYVEFLGRPAVNGEGQGWVDLLLRGQTEEEVLSGILASPEFSAHAQAVAGPGATPERFVQALYLLLLGRAGGSGEVAGWVNAIPQVGFRGVALGFLRSTEYRTDLVAGDYLTLLHRQGEPAGVRAWASSGLDATALRVGIESTPEFFANG
jgi:hypothetical protein